VLDEDERQRLLNVDLGEPASEQMRSFDVLAGLRVVTCSTLVCVGELDPVTPIAAAAELAAALGSARLEVIEGAGHWTWKDAPDTYWPLLTEFISRA
jgi:pimeloyl-ACP methyl ester carboxylesterase